MVAKTYDHLKYIPWDMGRLWLSIILRGMFLGIDLCVHMSHRCPSWPQNNKIPNNQANANNIADFKRCIDKTLDNGTTWSKDGFVPVICWAPSSSPKKNRLTPQVVKTLAPQGPYGFRHAALSELRDFLLLEKQNGCFHPRFEGGL